MIIKDEYGIEFNPILMKDTIKDRNLICKITVGATYADQLQNIFVNPIT